MIEKSFLPLMTIAAVMVGLGVAGIIMGAVIGSDFLLLTSPIFFVGAGGMAYRVRLEREKLTKAPQSIIFDPSKFRS